MKNQNILKSSFVKQNWFGLITILFMFIVLTSAVFLTGDIHELINVVENLHIKWVLLFSISILAYWLFDALILKTLTNIIYKDYLISDAFQVAMIGLFYSALTPFAGGGQPMQIYQMSKNNIKAGDGSSVIAIKSIIFQIVMTVFGIVAGIFSWTLFTGKISYFELMFFFGIITNVLFIFLIIFTCLSNRLVNKLSDFLISFLYRIKLIKNVDDSKSKVNQQIKIFHDGINYIKKEKSSIFIAVILTMIELCFYITIPYFIYRSFGINEIQFSNIVSASALILMITSFFPLPGGSGAVEGSFYVFFALFLPKNILLPMLLIWRFVTYYLCIIVGGLSQIKNVLSAKNKNL